MSLSKETTSAEQQLSVVDDDDSNLATVLSSSSPNHTPVKDNTDGTSKSTLSGTYFKLWQRTS